MASLGSPSAKAQALFKTIEPELMRLLDNAPQYGKITISGTLRGGRITSTDIGVEIKHNLDEQNGGA
jgi:hypothetical protein